MRHLRNTLVFTFLCSLTNAWAQLSTNELPVSFSEKMDMEAGDVNNVPTVVMPELDMAKIEAEDRQDEIDDIPPRFGYLHRVNFNLDNSGVWHLLPNGDRLWQLNVICPRALSVNFSYDKFWIPEGGKFFVYSRDRKHSIGAFTSQNNKGDKENAGGFLTGLVYGSDVILEYYQPKRVNDDPIISIDYVVHGYRYINYGAKLFGDAESCEVNVNCDEGQDWQNEKKAVALIVVDRNRLCTGALVNMTDFGQEPYLLTANHCVSSDGDACGDAILNNYAFYWNYETPGCNNTHIEPAYLSTSGATLLANNDYSDFALLRLTEDPKYLPSYTPYYLGWNRSTTNITAGVCIHHPRGDVKKISTVLNQPVSLISLWKVYWKNTEHGHGIVEGGSSGSPLFNHEHKVIGQLKGSIPLLSCDNPDEYSAYGKLNISWTGNNNDSICRRLNHWLDPIGTGELAIEGLLPISSNVVMSTNESMYSNIRINSGGQLTVQSNVILLGNGKVVVESGGKLEISDGSLSCVDIILKSGASLLIQNNGTINLSGEFIAADGAVIDITHGQILQ